MSAHTPTHPRIYALDRLSQIGPGDPEGDVASELILFLSTIGEATVANAARRALERIYGQ